jgi:long-chain acyl-CoA synthetase
MFEKIYSRIAEKGLSSGFLKRLVFSWSLQIGMRWAKLRDRRGKVGTFLKLKHWIADRLVFSKWRAAVGGRVRYFISGGAALAPDIAYVFFAAGLPIFEGYGLTETSPVVSCNTEDRNRVGTVGPVIDGVQVLIADDGEILVKGETVMKGYYNRPDATAQAFTQDGWLKTGDIGHLDSDGFLVITDRKKDLIKTSGGKYIAPQQIESLIKSSRFVSQVVVIGNGRKFASALIVPDMELINSYARLKGIVYSSPEDLLTNDLILSLMQRQVDKATDGLSKFEKIKGIALLGSDLSIEAGELTPTLKPRRKFIEEKYAKIIDRLYSESGDTVAVGAIE